MQPALRNVGNRRQIGIVPFGRARIDPGHQRIDVLLAEPGVVAELQARVGIRRPGRHLALQNLFLDRFGPGPRTSYDRSDTEDAISPGR